MLAVLDKILVSNAASAFVALVISAVILEVLAAIALVLLVMLAVLDKIRVSNAASAFIALVISALILEVLAAIALVLIVMLAVFEVINVGKVAMVVELTPPTAATVVENVPKPPPITSPVNSTY